MLKHFSIWQQPDKSWVIKNPDGMQIEGRIIDQGDAYQFAEYFEKEWIKNRLLTFERLSEINAERCEKAFHKIITWSPTDWACAMGGECGEALNKVKKLRRLDDSDKSKDTVEERKQMALEIADEVADTVIYGDLLCTRLGVSLEEAIIRKFNEVSDRRKCDIKL